MTSVSDQGTEDANVTPCGLCGGYGAYNDIRREPVPCMACGKESDGLVLIPVEMLHEPRISPSQRGGLRLVEGGGS